MLTPLMQMRAATTVSDGDDDDAEGVDEDEGREKRGKLRSVYNNEVNEKSLGDVELNNRQDGSDMTA